VDLSDPILVIPLPPEVFGEDFDDVGDLVIDGWHRIALAVHEGREEVQARFLTVAGERECRWGQEWDSFSSFDPWHATRRPGRKDN